MKQEKRTAPELPPSPGGQIGGVKLTRFQYLLIVLFILCALGVILTLGAGV